MREGSGQHLHLLPGAGAGLSAARELIAALPGDWRVTGSQELAPLETVPEIARRYRDDLDAAGLRPDVLAGWSFGGQVGFEMASGYDGRAPRLAVLDGPPPAGYQLPSAEVAFQAFAEMVLAATGMAPDAASRLVQPSDQWLSLHVLTAYLTAAGQVMPFDVLAARWQAYLRDIRASAVYLSDRQVRASALVIAAELSDAQLGQWARRLVPAPRLMRVPAGHVEMLRGTVAGEIGTAIAALAEAAVTAG